MAIVRRNAPIVGRPFGADETADCECGGVMRLQHGLTQPMRTETGLVIVANLSALVCSTCGSRSFDPPTYEILQSAFEAGRPGFGMRARVTRLSRTNVGIYIPKDLQEHLGLEAGDEVVLQPMAGRFIVAEVLHRAAERGKSESAARALRKD